MRLVGDLAGSRQWLGRAAKAGILLFALALWPLVSHAQMLVGAMPFGPVFRGLRPAGADTSLLLVARARRVGVSTFVQTTGTRGYLRLGPCQQLRYRLGTALAWEQVKDISEQITLWQASLTWLPTTRHALSLVGSAQLLRVDAPSKVNQQTRDEAQHLACLTWTGRRASSAFAPATTCG